MASSGRSSSRPGSPSSSDSFYSYSNHNTPVDASIKRYSLSDSLTDQHSRTTESYDNISSAVEHLLHQSSSNDDERSLDYHDVRSTLSLSRNSSATGASGSERYTRSTSSHGPLLSRHGSHSIDPGFEADLGEQFQPTAEYRPYQPGQYLAPILTGETLQLDEYQPSSTPSPTGNPFADPRILSVPVASHYSQGYGPSPDQPYALYDSHVLPAGTEGGVDHFRHDTEAYASGNYSRASFHPPRSRSPTPAMDDDDYQVAGDGSVHYSGYSEPYSPDHEKIEEDYEYSETDYHEYGQTPSYFSGEKTPAPSEHEPETPVATLHFGPAPPGRIVRRHKSKKRVHLTNGHLVIPLEVPPRLVLPRRGAPEMLKTRYTAVTCDPDDFEKKGYILRQNQLGRRTEMFIVITMFNVRCPGSSLQH